MSELRLRVPCFGVIFGLMLIGVVSHTPVRHLVQVSPAVLALLLSVPRPAWTRYAALPVHLVWLLLMVLIWLYLLGLARIVTGTFSPAEIVLTLVIGVSAAIGILLSVVGHPSPQPAGIRMALFSMFLVLQLFSIWFSLRPYIARR